MRTKKYETSQDNGRITVKEAIEQERAELIKEIGEKK